MIRDSGLTMVSENSFACNHSCWLKRPHLNTLSISRDFSQNEEEQHRQCHGSITSLNEKEN